MRLAPAGLAALILPACAGPGPAPGPTPPPAVTTLPDTARVLDLTYHSPAGTRRYRLFLPPGNSTRPHPLLLWLHGCTQTAEDAARGTGLDRHAVAADVMVAYPEQPESANPKRCWNWYDPVHQGRDGGEPALLAGLAYDIASAFPVDRNRIYIGGLSAGGAMAVTTALAWPDRFAAAGSHSGIAWGMASDVMTGLAAMRGAGASPEATAQRAWAAMGAQARAVPLIIVQGAADPVVAPAAADRLAAQFAALDRLAGFALSVDSASGETGGRQWERRRFRTRGGRVLLEDWRVSGLGHALSGGSAEGTWTDPAGPDAAGEMLRFFLDNSMRERE